MSCKNYASFDLLTTICSDTHDHETRPDSKLSNEFTMYVSLVFGKNKGRTVIRTMNYNTHSHETKRYNFFPPFLLSCVRIFVFYNSFDSFHVDRTQIRSICQWKVIERTYA